MGHNKIKTEKKAVSRIAVPPLFLTSLALANDACLELVHRVCGATCQQGLLTQEVLFVVIAHV